MEYRAINNSMRRINFWGYNSICIQKYNSTLWNGLFLALASDRSMEKYSLWAHGYTVKCVCLDARNSITKHSQRVTRHPVQMDCCVPPNHGSRLFDTSEDENLMRRPLWLMPGNGPSSNGCSQHANSPGFLHPWLTPVTPRDDDVVAGQGECDDSVMPTTTVDVTDMLLSTKLGGIF